MFKELKSAARVVLVVADVEALDLLQLVGLVKLPVLDLAAVEEYLLNIAPEAVVKGHDTVRVGTHVCDVGSTRVLPSCLPRQNKIGVIAAQDAREDEE